MIKSGHNCIVAQRQISVTDKQKASKIHEILMKTYPDVNCTLDYDSVEQLVFSCVLSSQSPDTTVNRVLKNLWAKYPGAKYIAAAALTDLERIIRPVGFFHVKARHLKTTAGLIISKFGGKVPDSIEELTQLSGIGRKMALVIVSEGFGRVEGVIVDTHNIRISNRLGLSSSKSAEKVEKDIARLLPRAKWRMWSHCCVFHGRATCTARNPKCAQCPVKQYCDYYKIAR